MSSEASGYHPPAPPPQGRPGGPTLLSVQPVAERGGSDQALLRLARQLSAAGWSVHIALPAPSPLAAEFAGAGAHLHVVPMLRISTSHGLGTWVSYALSWPVSVARLALLARRVKADAVHSNSLHSWYGWAVAALVRRPHIWHAREIVTQSKAALRVERFLTRRFARQVVAVSEAVAAQLSARNVVIVHEEPGPDECSPARAGRARARLGLADGTPMVGYVGRIDTWKGVDVLVDALPLLTTQAPGVVGIVAGGVVAGKEAYAAELERRATLAGATWLGPLSTQEAVDLIADLDCLAYPSTEPEPWGLAIVEALACGVPVVSTDAGGPREIVAGLAPTSALLVPPGDAQALAAALYALLPPSTSTDKRRARPVLRPGVPPDYPVLFATALSL